MRYFSYSQRVTPLHTYIQSGSRQACGNSSAPASRNSQFANWIDWMKVIGMFFIIWGHLSPEHIKHFIYAFSVPIFFIVSGYLFHHCDWSQFFKKNIRTLVVPYFLRGSSVICFFFLVKYYFGNYNDLYFPLSILSIIAGSQNGLGMDAIGCQALWFSFLSFRFSVPSLRDTQS